MRRWTLIVSVALVTTACVSQEELDRVTSERDALHAQMSDLKRKVEELERAKVGCEADLEAARKDSEKQSGARAKVRDARKALGLGDDQKLMARMQTSLGDIECELWPNVAPETVQNFVGLADGQRRPRHQRQPVLHHRLHAGPPEHEAHDLWQVRPVRDARDHQRAGRWPAALDASRRCDPEDREHHPRVTGRLCRPSTPVYKGRPAITSKAPW